MLDMTWPFFSLWLKFSHKPNNLSFFVTLALKTAHFSKITSCGSSIDVCSYVSALWQKVNIIFPLAIYDLGDVQWLKFPPSSCCSIIKVWKCLVCVCRYLVCMCKCLCSSITKLSICACVYMWEKEREGDVEWKTRGRRQSLMEGKWGSRSNLFPFFPSTV